MVVDSAIDAYALSLGFYIYDILWDIFVKTGIVYFPMIALLVNAVRSSLESAMEDQNTKSSLRTVSVGLFMMLLALEFAIYPMVKLEFSDIKYYTRQCTGDINAGGTITSDINGAEAEIVAGNMVAQLGDKDIMMPVLFYVAMALSQGVKNWAVQDLPCSTDIRLMADGMMAQRINDPVLLKETKNFIAQCFKPARRKWIREKGYSLSEDQNWPGGKKLLMTMGYYDNKDGNGFYSKAAYEGFGGTTNILEESENLPDGYGYPTCREWWLGVGVINTPYVDENSLSLRLYDHLEVWLKENDDEIYEVLMDDLNKVQLANYLYVAKKDVVVHQALFTPVKLEQLSANTSLDYGLEGDDGIADWLFRGLGTVGMAANSISQFSGASMLQLAMPMVKPFVIMLIVISFVPAIIIGRFKWKYVGLFLGVIMSVSFWPFFWELSRLIDDTLLTAMGIGFSEVNTLMFSQWIASALYVYAPLTFSTALGWVGMVSVDSAATNMSSSAGSAGKSGPQKLKQGANKGKQFVKNKMSEGSKK